MGAKNKATNTIINDETKNLGDIVYAMELIASIEATGLANFAMDLITACNHKNTNVKLELIKVENKASSQIEKPTLVIAIINNDLSKTQIQKAMDLVNKDYDPIGSVIERVIGVGDGDTPGPHDVNSRDPHIICETIKTGNTNPRAPANRTPDLPDLHKSPGPPTVKADQGDPGGRTHGVGETIHLVVTHNTTDLNTVIKAMNQRETQRKAKNLTIISRTTDLDTNVKARK